MHYQNGEMEELDEVLILNRKMMKKLNIYAAVIMQAWKFFVFLIP